MPPPYGKHVFFTIGKNWKTWFGPLCVSTSGQQKFAASFWNPKYSTDCKGYDASLYLFEFLNHEWNKINFL